MPRTMVGLLAAVATAMSALVGLVHGQLVWVIIGDAAVAAGLAAYCAAPLQKKSAQFTMVPSRTITESTSQVLVRRFAAGLSGRAFGLARINGLLGWQRLQGQG